MSRTKQAAGALPDSEIQALGVQALATWNAQGEATARDSQGRSWLFRSDREPSPALLLEATQGVDDAAQTARRLAHGVELATDDALAGVVSLVVSLDAELSEAGAKVR